MSSLGLTEVKNSKKGKREKKKKKQDSRVGGKKIKKKKSQNVLFSLRQKAILKKREKKWLGLGSIQSSCL